MRKYLLGLLFMLLVGLSSYALALEFGLEPNAARSIAVVVFVTGAVVFVTGAVVVAVAEAEAAGETRVKERWFFLATFSTLAFLAAGLSTTNPVLIFGLALSGALVLRQIGDLPKAELEVAKTGT